MYEHIKMCEMIDSTKFMHVCDCSKTQIMCDKALEKDSKMLKLAPDYFKTQEICNKAVKRLFLAMIHVPDRHKTQ